MSTGRKRAKFQRTTQEQLQFYVTYLRNHPELMASKSDPVLVRSLWNEVADNLNNLKGPTRSAYQWKASMYHWRNQLRCRARKAQDHKSIKEQIYSTVRSKNYEQVLDETDNENTNPVKIKLPTLGLKETQSKKADNSAPLVDLEELILKEEVESLSSPAADIQNSDTTFEFEFTKIEEDSNMDFEKDVEDEPSVESTRTLQTEDSNITNASATQAPLKPAARFLATEPLTTPTTEVKKKYSTGNTLQNIVAIIEKREEWEQKYREDHLKTQNSLAIAMKTLGEGMKSMGEAIKSLNESLMHIKQSREK